MTIGLLTAGVKGYSGNSTGRDVADTVNALYIQSGLSDPVMAVEPVDYHNIETLDVFNGVLFGLRLGSTQQVYTLDTATGTFSTYGAALPINGIRNIKCLSASSIIVEADGGTTIYKYYLTTDSGASWSLVLTMPFANIRMLTNRSICKAVVGGVETLFFGEYNINASRVNGSTNDAVRLLKSTDGGATWSEVARWNTDGTNNNIRHIHAVKQGPNGRIYVVTGDTNPQSAIYSWDGVSAWPANVSPSATAQTYGLKALFGRQAFRTIDIIFKDGWIYTLPDAETGQQSTNHQSGMWRVSQDMDISTLERISTVTTNQTSMAGWLADVLPTGELVWLGGNASPQSGQKYNPIIVSNKSWTEFKTVGAWRCVNSSVYIVPYDLRVIGSNVYVSCGDGSAKPEESTAVFKLSENEFKGDFETKYRPDTIHPVFWLDTVNGLDTNNGQKPSAAFKTLSYALTGSRLTYGARLQLVGDFQHNANSIIPVMSANSRAGDPAEALSISGSGATTTKLSLGPANANFGFFQMWGAAAQKIELQDLRLLNFKDTASMVTSNKASGGAGTHSFGFIRCIVGDYLNSTQRVSRFTTSNAMPIYAYSSIFECSESVANAMFDSLSAGEADYYFENCSVQSGNIHLKFQGTANKFSAYKTKFIGAFQYGLDIVAGAAFSNISALKCEWWGDGVPSSVAIRDLASLSWSGQFKMTEGNQARGVVAAFDGYSILNQGPIPLVNYKDYVN